MDQGSHVLMFQLHACCPCLDWPPDDGRLTPDALIHLPLSFSWPKPFRSTTFDRSTGSRSARFEPDSWRPFRRIVLDNERIRELQSPPSAGTSRLGSGSRQSTSLSTLRNLPVTPYPTNLRSRDSNQLIPSRMLGCDPLVFL